MLINVLVFYLNDSWEHWKTFSLFIHSHGMWYSHIARMLPRKYHQVTQNVSWRNVIYSSNVFIFPPYDSFQWVNAGSTFYPSFTQ